MEHEALTQKKELRVLILSGEKDAERAMFGLAYALTAVAMGYKVTVFLAMDGARLASDDLEDRIIVEKFESIPFYLNALLDSGVTIGVCTSCIEGYCENVFEATTANIPDNPSVNTPTSFSKPKVLKQGIKVMGIAALLHTTDGINTVVY